MARLRRKKKSQGQISKSTAVDYMQDVANWIEQWAAQVPKNDIPAFIRHRSKILQIDKKMRFILRWLQWYKPAIAKTVEEEFGERIGWDLADFPFPNPRNLDEKIIPFAGIAAKRVSDTLRHTAQMAREELTTEKPAETGQKVTADKRWWIRCWLWIRAWIWKLYEVTLKVIVDAVLERFWTR